MEEICVVGSIPEELYLAIPTMFPQRSPELPIHLTVAFKIKRLLIVSFVIITVEGLFKVTFKLPDFA